MELPLINPFLRYAELQPSLLSTVPFSYAYDYRLFFIVEGEASLVLSDRSLPLFPGTLLYFGPGIPYYFDGKVKGIVFNFDLTRQNEHLKKAHPPARSRELFDPDLLPAAPPPPELGEPRAVYGAHDAEPAVQECLHHYCYPSSVSDAATSALLKGLLCRVAQGEGERGTGERELAERITLYIRQNYDKELSGAQLSLVFGYHPFYLNRLFKKGTGKTLHRAVLEEKIRVAKRLLRETELSVQAVAEETGFGDRSAFCTVFKKQTGKTPLEYKRGSVGQKR